MSLAGLLRSRFMERPCLKKQGEQWLRMAPDILFCTCPFPAPTEMTLSCKINYLLIKPKEIHSFSSKLFIVFSPLVIAVQLIFRSQCVNSFCLPWGSLTLLLSDFREQ